MTPTPEQLYILDRANNTTANIMINALAGTGKTTMLEMIEKSAREKPILYLAFNRKVAEEATSKMATTTTVRTFNSLGHRLWAQTIGKHFKPESLKTSNMFRDIIDAATWKTKQELWGVYSSVIEGVAKAKTLGYIPPTHTRHEKSLTNWPTVEATLDEEPSGLAVKYINELLLKSIKAAYEGNCDFNDQLYMPTLFGASWPRFPLVLVDEYQDLNPVNHAMLRKLVKRRLIGVGDPWQSIYAFRGAKQDGMPDAVKEYKMLECDLSVSFRCPREIVRAVNWLVPTLKWSKEGGHVENLDKLLIEDIPDNATFICRNNAPLFSLAMRLLIKGRSVQITGSDIGPRVVKQLKKLGHADLPNPEVITAIDRWEATQIQNGSKTARDVAECMRVFAGHGRTLSQAITYVEYLFKQTGRILFTTGHKAKGLEYPVVFHLNPFLLGKTRQEKNLEYVITTRSSDKFYTVNTSDILD